MTQQKQTSERNPGCAEYAIIILLVVLVTIPLLIASKLGWISQEQLDRWGKRLNKPTG